MMQHTPYRQIGIIGTGRVARALALGLAPFSARPPLLWGRSLDRLRAAIAQNASAIAATSAAALVKASDVIVLAVSDDALASVIADLAASATFAHGPLVFHVSGGSGVANLDPLRADGAQTAAIHPAMTFTGDPASEVRRMAGARFAITGSGAVASERARDIVHRLGGVPVTIAQEHRALYHAALCHAANHLVTLLSGSSQALRAAGVDDPAGLLAPLVRAALENSLAQGFAALSGPLLRGDGATIRDHLTALDTDCAAVAPAYRAMALATLDTIEREGMPMAAGLRQVLA